MTETENYIKQKRLDLYNSISTTKKIYLDTNYWIKLRDAEKNSNQTDKKLIDKLKELVKLKKCILPISEITFWEILKQNDFKTLKESATLIDEFSNGISLISDEERRQLEFLIFLRKAQKKPTIESIELVWTKLSMNILYNNLPQPEQFDLKIKFIEFLESITFFDIVTIMEEKEIFKPFYFKDNVDFLNEAKEKYKNENKSFEQLFLSELGGYIDCFKDSLNHTMEQMYYWEHGKHITETDKSTIDQNDLKNIMYNLFRLNKVTTEFPTFSIIPELCASVRWNQSRKYVDGNDTIDFLHATSALPYFDFFFTEKELRTIICQRKLDTRYNCIVESDANKILDLLDTL
jgi:hypothetical protein